MSNKQYPQFASEWVAVLDTLKGDMSVSESKGWIRQVLAALLMLRWIDAQVFDGASQAPLPERLRWRNWARLESPLALDGHLQELVRRCDSLSNPTRSVDRFLHVLVGPLQKILDLNPVYSSKLIRWVDGLPFDTLAERRALLEKFDQVVAETSDPHDGLYATPANIARFIAAIANPLSGEQVYDPCFGSGNLLLAAWQEAEVNREGCGRAIEVAGIELNADAFLIGAIRMVLAGIESPHLERDNTLQRDLLSDPEFPSFDIVIANPPVGTKTSSEPGRYRHFPIVSYDSTGLFIQHAFAKLKPRGRAVIAVPEGFLFRGGTEKDLRRYLLEKGHVDAVIGLPANAFNPYASIKGALLVLNKQGGTRHVRMVDATAMFEKLPHVRSPVMPAAIAKELANKIRRHDLFEFGEVSVQGSEGVLNAKVLARAVWEVEISEMAAIDWDLSPRRREKGGLSELLEIIHEALGKTVSTAPLSSLALISAGRPIKSIDLLNEPPPGGGVAYVRIRDLSQGRVGRVSSWLRSELVKLEQRWALQAGDVLLSKSGTIGKAAMARNDAVGAIAANGLYVLRPDQKKLDAGFLLAYLSSAACQNWLSAQTRGSVIQHLNRRVLDELPVPLPPLSLQARAAAQFRDFGTDVLTFLTQAMGGNESDFLLNWLAELDNKVPKNLNDLNDAPQLSHFEPIVALANNAQKWVDQAQELGRAPPPWLLLFIQTLLQLVGVGQIPPGPALFNVLQQVERGIVSALENAIGHLPIESQARAVGERLRDWLNSHISDMINTVAIKIGELPPYLTAGELVEFSVQLENTASLPLRQVRVTTTPDWGVANIPYLMEKGMCPIRLSGNVPQNGASVLLHLQVQAHVLTGELIEVGFELPIRTVDVNQAVNGSYSELGGSPYVTGSPLEPMQGHSVFFGRDELLNRIARQIVTHGNVVLLEGNRRAGKTSILKHLEGRNAIPTWLAVYASLQGAEGAPHVKGVPTVQVYREIARSIATALKKQNIDVPLPDGTILPAHSPTLGIARACRNGIRSETPFVDFREYFEAVMASVSELGLGLVLMLDEFDKLQEGIDSGVTSPQVPENIRFMIQSYPRFSAILTGSRRLKRLREEYWSALYGLGINVSVTALDADSARKVVTEPVRNRLVFSPEAIARVIEITARQPYLMQCLCNTIFDIAAQTNNRSITAILVNNAAQFLVRDNEHFANLWDSAALGANLGGFRRQLILSICARSFKQGKHLDFGTLHETLTQEGVDVAEDALDADLSYLRELELVEFTGRSGDGEYRLAVPLMADWIEQQHDSNVVSSRARTEAEEENG